MTKNNVVNLRKRATSDDIDQFLSHIGERRESLLARFKSGENLDTAAFDLTAALLAAIVQALPTLEMNLKAPRGVYPFVNLTTLTRELLHDLRMMQDRTALKKAIIEEIVEPQLTAYATELNSMLNRIAKRSDREAITLVNGVKEKSGMAINTLHREISTRLDKYLEGTGEIPPPIVKETIRQEDDVFLRGPLKKKRNPSDDE